jgi:hypothetical protein
MGLFWQFLCTSTDTNPPIMDIIYITRKENLFDHNSTRAISLSKWSAFVANDPEMRLDNQTSVLLPNGEIYQYASPGTAVWLNREPGQSAVREVIFDYRDGNIVINNPDKKTIDKVRHIAFKLNAHIFMETKSFIAELPVEIPMVKPRFRFSDALNPFKRAIPQLRYFFKHIALSFFKGGRSTGGEHQTSTVAGQVMSQESQASSPLLLSPFTMASVEKADLVSIRPK